MDMQDKEFDGLFRDKLNGFESEPSEKVWTGIDRELDKKKIALLPWLSVAASIIMLVSAGILFIPKAHKTGGNSDGIVKVQLPAAKPIEQIAVSAPPVKKNEQIKRRKEINTERHKKPTSVVNAPVTQDVAIVKTEPVKTTPQPEIIAQVTPKTEQVKQALVPDLETPLVVKPNADSAMNTKPALIAKIQPVMKPEMPAVKKHGIRSFGELVNLVVAKVDKRKEKAVHFSEDDDGDGSTLTAVNIGPVKIGSDR